MTKITMRVRFRWWFIPLIKTLAFVHRLTRLTLNTEAVSRLVMRGASVEVEHAFKDE